MVVQAVIEGVQRGEHIRRWKAPAVGRNWSFGSTGDYGSVVAKSQQCSGEMKFMGVQI